MNKSKIKVEKDFEFYLEVLIAAFVGFFAVYPFVLDILDKRPNAVDAFILSAAFSIIIMISILFSATHLAKKK